MASAFLSISLPQKAVWWREPEWGLLVLLVWAGYFFRASEIPMRGEEPRRALVAAEMIDGHDWLVPRTLGNVFLSRPPLQNWLIGLSFLGFGEREAFPTRLPSLLAILFTVLLLYGYGRTFLSRIGAFAGAAAYCTFGEIFHLGQLAETEALFTFLVTASLLLWHWGMIKGWSDALTWSLGYGFMALGALTKGLQAPFYFGVSVTAYLLIMRQGRRLFTWSHLTGIGVGGAILAAWNLPVIGEVGWDAWYAIWMNDTAPRLLGWSGFLTHLVTFPLEVLACTLPWSPLVLFFLHRDLRQNLGERRPLVLFLGLVLVLGFPTCWLPPHGATRYLMPLYPCFALLLGFVIQCLGEASPQSFLGKGWRQYLAGMAGVMMVFALLLPCAWLFQENRVLGAWAEPPALLTLFIAGALVLAWVTRQAANFSWKTGWSVSAIALFMVLLFKGPVHNVKVRRGEDIRASVLKLKEQLPPDVSLVCFNNINAGLPLFMQKLIPAFPWPEKPPYPVAEGDFFCFERTGPITPDLPFPWQEVAVIPVDRNKQPIPHAVIVVGRRIPFH